MVAVKGEVPLFVAVKAGMFPVPEVASPMEELLFVQLTEAPAGVVVNVVAAIVSPAHADLFAGVVKEGVADTEMFCVALVVPQLLVTASVIVCAPPLLNVTAPGFKLADVAGVPPGNVHR